MKNVFLNRSTIDEDWDRFVQKAKISNPDAYLNEVRLPIECLEFLEIGISTICNFDCPFCFNHYSRQTGYYSKTELAGAKVIELIKSNRPIQEIQLAVCGEPLLHHQFFDILDGISKHVRGIRISTNASLLLPDIVDRLADYPISWISISTDASDKTTYERLRRHGRFDIFKRNVGYAQKVFADKMSFTAVLNNVNSESILGMPELSKDLKITKIHLLDAVIHPKHKDRGIRRLSPPETLSFMTKFLKVCEHHGIQASWFQRLMDLKTTKALKQSAGDYHYIDPDLYHSPCGIPLKQLSIDPEGNFNSCCSVDPKYGDALNRPFNELFNDPQTLKLRVLNQFQSFARICKKYCHKVSIGTGDYSIENLRNMMSTFKLAPHINWKKIEKLPGRIRLLGWPCGTLAKNLTNDFRRADLDFIGLADKNPELWGTSLNGVPIYSPQEALGLDVDAILITTNTFHHEILVEIDHLIGLSTKNIYMIKPDLSLLQMTCSKN
jgi:MoaA/NifB/PqqE/SkfB family radical SAM enzyme